MLVDEITTPSQQRWRASIFKPHGTHHDNDGRRSEAPQSHLAYKPVATTSYLSRTPLHVFGWPNAIH